MQVTTHRHIETIAVIDGHAIPAPPDVQGIVSAADWLNDEHPDALSAEFFEAIRIGDHPVLIGGGVYQAALPLGSLMRGAS